MFLIYGLYDSPDLFTKITPSEGHLLYINLDYHYT